MREAIVRQDPTGVVSIGDCHDPLLVTLAEQARGVIGDIDAAIALGIKWGEQLPAPGQGRTALLWSALATLGATDLTVARVLEPHLDALAIIGQARAAGLPVPGLPDGAYGVFAAEGPGMRVSAKGDRLTGSKPWCSLAGVLDAALITAWDGETRRLYAVDLRDERVRAESGGWISRGLRDVPSLTVHLDDVPAIPVGPAGWYLTRPGFAWGGIGVATIWYGAAVALARRLLPTAGGREPDQIALLHLGEAEMQLASAASVLARYADIVDDDAQLDSGQRVDSRRLALTARGVTARVALEVMQRVGRAVGPAPLARDEEHARRVADLEVYVRQDHAERDAAALGALLAS